MENPRPASVIAIPANPMITFSGTMRRDRRSGNTLASTIQMITKNKGRNGNQTDRRIFTGDRVLNARTSQNNQNATQMMNSINPKTTK